MNEDTYREPKSVSDIFLRCSRHGEQPIWRHGVNDVDYPVHTMFLTLFCGCQFEFRHGEPDYQGNLKEDGNLLPANAVEVR